MRKKIEEVDRSWNKNMTPVMCPACYIQFGLCDGFLRGVDELTFKFTCPYCGKQYSLKKV